MLALIRTNALRRWGRTVLTTLGVAIGVMTVVALLSLTGGLSRSAGDLATLGRADFGVFQAGLADLTASSLPNSIVSRVREMPGVAQASPVQIVPNAVAGESSILVFGSEPDSFLTKRLVVTAGRGARGAEAMVGVRAAERLHVGPGETLTIGDRRFPVAGVYRSGVSFEDDGVVLPLAVTQRVFSRGPEISMIAVSVSPGHREGDVEREIQRRVPGTVAIGDPKEVSRVDTNSRVVSKAAIVIAALAVLVGAVVVTNTMAMSMMQRQGEFGLLAAVGWWRADIAKLIVGESLAVSLVGTAIGLGLGALAGHLLVNVLAAATFVSPDVTTWVLIRLLVRVGLGVLGALFSVAQVLRVPPRRHWDVPDESVVVHATDPRVEPMHSPGKPGMLTPAREKAARIWLIRHVIEEPEPLIRS